MILFDRLRVVVQAARLVLFALVAGLLFACSAPGQESLVLHTSTGNYTFQVEIAETDASREKGLMFRTSLAPDAGMLFDFHAEGQRAFWMQNTLIPLDMIFVAEDGTIKTIHENARPMDTTAIPSQAPVRFVLEIAGGRSAEIGLKTGDKMDQSRVGTPQSSN
jgi:uncharacterized protein